MKNKLKNEILIFLAVFGILSLLLSTGLSNMIFEKGIPLPRIDSGEGTISLPEKDINSTFKINELSKIILIIIIAIAIIILIYRIIKKINWKDFVSIFFNIFLIILVITGIIFIILISIPHYTRPLNEIFIPVPEKQQWVPLGEVPVIFLWIIGFVLAGLVLFLIIIISKSKKQKDQTSNLIELEALHAINELQRGKDFKDVIIKCYHKMCLALQHEQEIEREESMTVGEFEQRLEAAGAPQKSVHQLTELFEAVRYGNWKPRSTDEKKAIICFNDIIRYFTEKGKVDNEKK